MSVAVTVADRAAVDDHRVVEQRAVAVGGGPELLDEVSEQLQVVRVDAGDLLHELRVAAMVGERMVRVGNADLGIALQAPLASDHHGRDAREVGLEGHHLEVEHQLDVLGERRGDAGRLLDARRELGAFLFRPLQPPLDLPDRVEVLVHLAPVGRAEAGDELARALAHDVQDALALPGPPGPAFRGQGHVVDAEEPLEDRAGIRLGRHGRGGRAPRDAVGVGAAVARVAVADGARLFAAQLQRRQAGLRADGLGRDLVRRDAVLDVRARRLPGMDAGQEARPRPRVVPGAVTERVGVVVGQAGQHEQVLTKRL